MALKKKITKAEYDKLSDEAKKNYKAGEYSDTFVLDIDGEDESDDPAELRRALAREKEDRKKAQKELKQLREKAESDDDGDDDGEADDDNTPPVKGNKNQRRAAEDAKKIDADWKKKFDKTTGELNTKLAKQNDFIKKTLVGKTSELIAGKISTSPKLMAKAIAERLSVDFDGDEPELVILGDDGKPSGLSLDKLEKEFVANKEYSSIIIGSKASGGGAPKVGSENPPVGGAPASDTKTDLSKLAGKDLAATLKARKEAQQQS